MYILLLREDCIVNEVAVKLWIRYSNVINPSDKVEELIILNNINYKLQYFQYFSLKKRMHLGIGDTGDSK